jgi:hypothetical protein
MVATVHSSSEEQAEILQLCDEELSPRDRLRE